MKTDPAVSALSFAVDPREGLLSDPELLRSAVELWVPADFAARLVCC